MVKHTATRESDHVEVLNKTLAMRSGHGPKMVARSQIFLLTGQHLSKEKDGAVSHATGLLLPDGPTDIEKT